MSEPGAHPKQLLFCSWYAFDRATWAVLEELVRTHGFRATVIAPAKVHVGIVYTPSGFLTPDLVDTSIAEMHLLPLLNPDTPTNGFAPDSLRKALAGIRPDAIWIYSEPVDGLTRQILKHFYFRRHIPVACFLAENLWRRPPFDHRLKSRILFHRIDALLACGTVSSEAIYRTMMPRSVRAHTVFMPNFDPRSAPVGAFTLERGLGEFWIGFAGKLVAEKGWRVLLSALQKLPVNVKTVIAGDGPDMREVERHIVEHGLTGRVLLPGPLNAADVRAMFAQIDVAVVPSLTTPRWMEQFGRVIAEAMGAGKPVIGSNSGAIPEVVGEAGLIVPEGDATALAAAIKTLLDDSSLKDRLGRAARQRFENEFSVSAYAGRLAQLLKRV